MGANWLPTTWTDPSFSMISRKTWSYCGKEFAGCASRVDAQGMKARHNTSTALVRRADRRILQRFMQAPFLLLHCVGAMVNRSGCCALGLQGERIPRKTERVSPTGSDCGVCEEWGHVGPFLKREQR